jgi:hypothetical protein
VRRGAFCQSITDLSLCGEPGADLSNVLQAAVVVEKANKHQMMKIVVHVDDEVAINV